MSDEFGGGFPAARRSVFAALPDGKSDEPLYGVWYHPKPARAGKCRLTGGVNEVKNSPADCF